MAIRVHGNWVDPCPSCGALDGCCATALARMETAKSLTRLVDKQRVKIEEDGRLIAELRRKLEAQPA